MASKSGQQEPEKAEVVEELLDALDSTLERVKVLYEQYFLGIQKQPPTFLHTDIERKVRDLAQMNIRNTALRYRHATLSQKFGSYNSYWRRTLRQIENGTYTRNLSKIGRQAARNGADVPDEILAAMPKRMREQVKRDRDAALANAKRRAKPVSDGSELITLSDEDVEIDVDDFEPAAFVGESTDIRRNVLTTGGVHRIDDDDEFDVDAFFARVTSEGDPNPLPVGGAPAAAAPTPAPAPAPAAAPTPAPAAPKAVTATPKAAPAAAAPKAAVATAAPKAAPPAAAPKAAPPRKRTGSSGHPRPASISGSWTDPSPPGAGHTPSAAPPPAAAPPEPAPPARPTPPAMPAAKANQPLPRMATQPGAAGPALAAAPPPAPASPASPPVVTPPIPRAVAAPIAAIRSASPIAPASVAPSQATRPLPISPGAAAARTPAPVETMAGPFPRIPSLPPVPSPPRSPAVSQAPDLERPAPPRASRSPSIPAVPAVPMRPAAPPAAAKPPAEPAPAAEPPPSAPAAAPERPTPPPRVQRPRPPSARPVPEPRQAPPPGMSDADVNALYAKYVQAKQIVGEQADPGAYGKLLKTINAQAPKIMEQYKSKGVDFSVIVKDNQVIIRAKPKP